GFLHPLYVAVPRRPPTGSAARQPVRNRAKPESGAWAADSQGVRVRVLVGAGRRPGRRGAQVRRRQVLVAVVAAAAVVLCPAPAVAASSGPTVDCVVKTPHGTYRAVFGYDSASPDT